MSLSNQSVPPIIGEHCYYNTMYKAFQKLDPNRNVYFSVLTKDGKEVYCNYSLPQKTSQSKGEIKQVLTGPHIDSVPEILNWLN